MAVEFDQMRDQVAAYEQAVGRALLCYQVARNRARANLDTSTSSTPGLTSFTCTSDNAPMVHKFESSLSPPSLPVPAKRSKFDVVESEHHNDETQSHGMLPRDIRQPFSCTGLKAPFPTRGFTASQQTTLWSFERSTCRTDDTRAPPRISSHKKEAEHYPQASGAERTVNAVSESTGWTPELDNKLRTEIRMQKQSGHRTIQWSKIAQSLKNRSGSQCQARWVEVLDEKIAKGRWSSEEDQLLMQYHAELGAQWSKIATRIRTRTQRQCRSRWLQMQASFSGHALQHNAMSLQREQNL